jgi:maintenance of mitochondrial morphology protein 1
MGSNYVFTLQPTFTQGLILGQLSILVLLVLILKYLFLDSTEFPTSSYHPRLDSDTSLRNQKHFSQEAAENNILEWGAESTEWFNMILQQVREPFVRIYSRSETF